MHAKPEFGGTYPLSPEPLEGYGSTPKDRSGKYIISHINGGFVKQGQVELVLVVSDRKDATVYPDASAAAIAAGKIVSAAREEAAVV